MLDAQYGKYANVEVASPCPLQIEEVHRGASEEGEGLRQTDCQVVSDHPASKQLSEALRRAQLAWTVLKCLFADQKNR